VLHPDFSELEDEFSEVVGFLNEGRPEVPTERPSEMVWSAIADALTVSDGPVSSTDAGMDTSTEVSELGADRFGQQHIDQHDDQHHPGNGVVTNGAFPAAPAEAPASGFNNHADSNVRPLQRPNTSVDSGGRSMGKRFAVITAVAAAILLVAVPLSLSLRGESLDQRAELLALGESSGLGTAELTDRTLAVDLEGLQPLDGANYELWLLDLEGDDLEDLVWIGVVNEDGTFTVPEGVDLDEFSVVDVSIEPEDGDETHSGNSVLRGPLSEA
jgi:hypothetical protein